MIKDIRHSGIVVDDMEMSLHFYKDLLGFKIEKQMQEGGSYLEMVLALDGVDVKTCKLSAGDGSLIELLEFNSHPQKKKERALYDIGISHIAFTVEDVQSTYRKLSSLKVPFLSEPQRSPDLYAKVAFCRAPEGTYIEIVEVL